MKGGTPCMGISPGRTHAHTSTSARARALPSTRFIRQRCTGRMSLKKCVFGCKGKITLFSFPKNPVLREQWMHFVFPGQQWSYASVFVDERFINKAQFDAGFAHHLILKDGTVPAIKDPSYDSELQMVKMSVFCWQPTLSARHSLAPPTAFYFL